MRNIHDPKCIYAKQQSLKIPESKQIQLKGETDKSATLTEGFSTLSSATFRIIRQKIRENMEDMNSTSKQDYPTYLLH